MGSVARRGLAINRPTCANNATSLINTTATTSTSANFRTFSTTPAANDLDNLGSVDHGFEDDRLDPVADPEKRAFTYFLLGGVR